MRGESPMNEFRLDGRLAGPANPQAPWADVTTMLMVFRVLHVAPHLPSPARDGAGSAGRASVQAPRPSGSKRPLILRPKIAPRP